MGQRKSKKYEIFWPDNKDSASKKLKKSMA
jgi:hypothetical protein